MSSAADPTAAFFANLLACGLLQSAQVRELAAWIASNRPDLQTLAKEITRRGWLTAFQIKEVFKGRGRDLTLDRYVLKDLLGEGGMGRVYKAHDTRMGRDLAIKVIRKDKLKHPAAADRFAQEIQALSKMSHPNVVTVFDAGNAGDTHFYVMEFIDGTDLTKIVRDRGPLPLPEACESIRQAALGLHHAFEMGLVHRDIKPSNIIVSRNGRVVKLVDLGLARLMDSPTGGDEAHRITQEGFVIGTPDFLAPEQARNPMAVDIRADIYALGGTLFYILTGKVPFDGANPTEKLIKHCTEPPPGLLRHRSDAPVQVEQIIHWSMAKLQEARPQTPLQLALALQPFCPTTPSSGRNPLPTPRSGPAAPVPPGFAYPAPAQGLPRAPPPGFPVPPHPDPNRSSQVFKLPPQRNEADPIRRRSAAGFPWSTILLGLGAMFVIGLLAWAIFDQFVSSSEKPIESFTNSQNIKMVKLMGGKFRMGSPENEEGRRPDESPQHEVVITGPFLIAATEVTHAQFLKVMGVSPAKSGGIASKAQNLPIESVTWDEANDFCKKLTDMEKAKPWARKGWAYRLPTEAEWEYAARAGTDGPFASGNQIVFGKEALFRPITDRADPYGIADESTKPPTLPQEVGKTEPNKFGLYDMHGNVAEWCLDWYKPVYSESPQTDPTGPSDGDKRVVRGGSFKDPSTGIRSASRRGVRPSDHRDDVGFRIVFAPMGK